MSTDAKVAITIFAVAMVGTIGLGIAAMRGRDADRRASGRSAAARSA